MSVRELTYDEALQLFVEANGAGEFTRFESAYNAWGVEVGTDEIVNVLKNQGVLDSKWVAVGNGNVSATLNGAGNISGYSAEFNSSYPSAINSNVRTSGTIKTPINTTATMVEERSVMSAKVGLREAGTFAIGSVVPAILASGVGISLGKTIDSTLYNLNPDFWDAHNMSSLNPETWNSITTDYDGVAGTLFDAIFGLNSDGTSQAYIDEDALTYLAMWLAEQGVFNEGDTEVEIDDPVSTISGGTYTVLKAPTIVKPAFMGSYAYGYESTIVLHSATITSSSSPIIVWADRTASRIEWTFLSKKPFTLSSSLNSPVNNPSTQYSRNYSTTIGGVSYEISYLTLVSYFSNFTESSLNSVPVTTTSSTNAINWNELVTPTSSNYQTAYYYTLLYQSTLVTNEPIDGIGTQEDATLPTTSDWTSLPATKQSLQQQYPDLWTNAKHQDYVDDNGQNRTKTLIPINLPNASSPFDTQPTSGNRDQQDPLVDPTTATEDLLKTITDTITKLIDMIPTDTGSGDSPVVPVPTGSASSLWKIYNPTQAQVDSFGAWLWDSSFVEQIKKLFNDPMQAIIGIHKVFATPSTGGTTTIKVGYLDSEVSSKWVDNQYTTINCGTIKLYEEFGNVFDYNPYTRVSLYLPFIGIVDLDVADVMRASITVKYHVDVLSGACLADVIVNRDSSGGVLYQYSGSAIVTYPVSSGNYMGMVAGVLSVAGGLAGTIMTGGALAPALIGGAVGMSHLHTDVSHSGSFSGCAGAMAGKKPYLIISRPQTHMAENFKHFTGLPANAHVKLDDCEGFTRVKSVYVTTSSKSTDEEKDMIETKLKEGVLI